MLSQSGVNFAVSFLGITIARSNTLVRFDRQDLASTNASEAAFFSSISNLEYEARDLKIDVFGGVGIATYYPHVSFIKDGEVKTVDGRQTLVFLNTSDGWKIVHEHGTIRR